MIWFALVPIYNMWFDCVHILCFYCKPCLQIKSLSGFHHVKTELNWTRRSSQRDLKTSNKETSAGYSASLSSFNTKSVLHWISLQQKKKKPNFSSFAVPHDFDFGFKGFQVRTDLHAKPFNYQVSSKWGIPVCLSGSVSEE